MVYHARPTGPRLLTVYFNYSLLMKAFPGRHLFIVSIKYTHPGAQCQGNFLRRRVIPPAPEYRHVRISNCSNVPTFCLHLNGNGRTYPVTRTADSFPNPPLFPVNTNILFQNVFSRIHGHSFRLEMHRKLW